MTKELKLATILALSTALISGISNFIAKIGVTAIKDPIVFTSLKNSLVALVLIGLVIAFRKIHEIKSLNKSQWMKLVSIGIIGGFIPFALFFTGLANTSAINASLIHKTLFIWVLLLAVPLLKEKVSLGVLTGMGTIFVANFIIGGFKGFLFNTAELMILGATLLWAIENIIAKKALADISSTLVASARMVFGSVLLLGLVAWQGNLNLFSQMTVIKWSWTFLSSILLLGYVLTWYTALKYAPAYYIASLLVPASVVTNILSAIFITHSLSSGVAINGLIYTIGISLIIYYAQKAAHIPLKDHEKLPISA